MEGAYGRLWKRGVLGGEQVLPWQRERPGGSCASPGQAPLGTWAAAEPSVSGPIGLQKVLPEASRQKDNYAPVCHHRAHAACDQLNL